jgi:hypothetical protein
LTVLLHLLLVLLLLVIVLVAGLRDLLAQLQ